jgi:hypothetical protein
MTSTSPGRFRDEEEEQAAEDEDEDGGPLEDDDEERPPRPDRLLPSTRFTHPTCLSTTLCALWSATHSTAMMWRRHSCRDVSARPSSG